MLLTAVLYVQTMSETFNNFSCRFGKHIGYTYN